MAGIFMFALIILFGLVGIVSWLLWQLVKHDSIKHDMEYHWNNEKK